jgi:hypothetical protein
MKKDWKVGDYCSLTRTGKVLWEVQDLYAPTKEVIGLWVFRITNGKVKVKLVYVGKAYPKAKQTDLSEMVSAYCEDFPCCGHEMGDCNGELYGSNESIKKRAMARARRDGYDDYYDQR